MFTDSVQGELLKLFVILEELCKSAVWSGNTVVYLVLCCTLVVKIEKQIKVSVLNCNMNCIFLKRQHSSFKSVCILQEVRNVLFWLVCSMYQ